jgi:ribosomal protein S18
VVALLVGYPTVPVFLAGGDCVWCSSFLGLLNLNPHLVSSSSLQNTPLLENFLESNGRILPRSRSYLCHKHQRKLNKTVKRAISLGLLSYKKRVFQHINPFLVPSPPPIYCGVLESDLPDEVVEEIKRHRAELAEKKHSRQQFHHKK